MQYVSVMDGDLLTFPPIVFAGSRLLSNMLCVAPLVVSLLSDTMSSVMLQLTCFLRSAQTYRLNHSFNHSLVDHCPTVLPTLMTMPDWIYLQEVCGTLFMSKLLSM